MLKTPPKPARHSVTVIEQTIAGGRVDHEAGTIRQVKILGTTSKNNREYTRDAMLEAAEHYRGVKVHLNHPGKTEIKRSRAIESWIGTLENITVRESGVYGDLHMLTKHPYAGAILEAAERYPDKFGLSHNADCSGHYEGRREIIESVEKVRSVDVVSSPATNVSLFESILEMDGMADMGLTPTMGPGPDVQTDDAEPGDTDDAKALDDIQTILNDAEMAADEQIAGIKAILSGVGREAAAVQESYDGAHSALNFTNSKSFAAAIRGPASRPSGRRSFSLVEQIQESSDPRSALPFKNAKGLAALIR